MIEADFIKRDVSEQPGMHLTANPTAAAGQMSVRVL